MDHTIVHFEIPADDPARARAFYEDVFGWDMAKVPAMDYWMFKTVESDDQGQPKRPGVNGAMMKRMYPGQSPLNYFGVADIEAHTAKLVAAGGEVLVPKMAVPGHGWFVQFKDTEGNILALWQVDSQAA